MNEYMFYTDEGHTLAPNEDVAVENCQLLGTARGCDKQEALGALLSENPWIAQAGFDASRFFVRQLIND